MKNKSVSILIAVALGLVGILASTAQETESAQAKAGAARWEHLAMSVEATDGPGDAKTSRKIVQLGNEGWELVDVEALTTDGTTTKLIYFFKRPK